LDINMPEMNGFELCSKLKADARFREIPVIFLSAATDTSDKVEAFSRGGVDYITKPFHPDEVKARVQTHLRIQKLLDAERQLLERTLSGAVRMLVDCLQITSPRAFGQSSRLHQCMNHIATDLKVVDRWSFGIAGSLAYIGCIALPESLVERFLTGQPTTEDERHQFQRHATFGKELLSGVPRLETVAEIIGCQHPETPLPSGPHDVILGARALRAAQAFEGALQLGATPEVALQRIQSTRKFDETVIQSLARFKVSLPSDQIVEGGLKDLAVGSILVKPVETVDGNIKLLAAGHEITDVVKLRLRQFVETGRIRNTFVFRMPPRAGKA
jgi:hypothetical protein